MQELAGGFYKKLSKLSVSQIQRVTNELRSQNEMFRSAIQSLSMGLIIVDNDWKILELNKASERLIPFKSSFREQKDKNKRLFALIDDKDMISFFKDCYENNRTNVRDEYTISTSGGSVRFIEVSVIPFVEENKISGSIISVDDITEKRNQETLLHRMETMAGLTNLAASVAHEIKNPLGAISIHIQLVQKALKKKRESDGLLPEPKFMENYLDIVNQEIDRLNKIIVDFLMAVRPISADLELVRVNELLTSFVEFITPEFNARHIQIVFDFCEPCPKILIDQKLFREVIVNMAQNSLAAISERFEKADSSSHFEKIEEGKLEIRTEVKNDQFVLYFKDNGEGMSEESKSRVFEPYYTTKANGTGLGMAMSYKIIKEFSGDISVESSPGNGTCFTIMIPIPQSKTRRLIHVEKDLKREEK